MLHLDFSLGMRHFLTLLVSGSGIRTAGNTAKQLDASLRKGGLGTGTNPAA